MLLEPHDIPYLKHTMGEWEWHQIYEPNTGKKEGKYVATFSHSCQENSTPLMPP